MYDRYGLVVGSMAGMAIVVFGESRTCIYTSVWAAAIQFS